MNKSQSNLHVLCSWLVGLAVVGVGLTAVPDDADACGGFFCNQQQPVRQSFERIIFADNMDGTVTAAIQIQYQGPSEEFAWLLPVPGEPDVGVSSNQALTRIGNATAPSYQMETTVEGECASRSSGGLFGGAENVAASDSVDRAEEDDGVDVIKGGTVGPYNFKVISVSESADDPAQDALDWLEDNGYDLGGDIGPDIISEYLEDGMNLLAFKLTKDAESGEIRPVKITYEWPEPMIPIKLTAVAVQSDMGIAVWLAGPNRGIPTKYNALELNQAAINWFQWRSNYDQVVTQAADEAGGQGFVTEYADKSSEVENVIFTEDDAETWSSLQGNEWQGKEGDLLFDVINTYANWDGLTRAIRQGVELPQDTSAQDVVDSPNRHFDQSAGDIDGLEPDTFLQAVEDNVVGPMRDTEELVQSQDYLTRLYTTMSADEMDIDPVFSFNPDLPDVSNTHTAERTVYCSNRVTRPEAPWEAELPDGTVVHGTGNQWPFQTSNGNNNGNQTELPANREIKRVETSGTGEIVQDNNASIQETIDAHNSNTSLDPGGCGCSTGGDEPRPGSALWLVLIGLGGWLMRRR